MTSNAPPQTSSPGRTYSRNVAVTAFGLFVTTASGLVLPSFLTRHFPIALYSAWILILQIAAYVGLLDFGIQTAISKYIAEHSTGQDNSTNDLVHQYASVGTTVTLGLGSLGLLLSGALSLLVPHLFHALTPALTRDVQRGVLLVGGSNAILLACSSFAAFFRGLQRFTEPTLIALASKLLSVALIVTLVARHASLTAMGVALAMLNLLTAAAQVLAWRVLLPQIKLRLALVTLPVIRQVLAYCAVLGLWGAGMLIIMGLDLTIVGRFDFPSTAFYAVASTPITFLLLLLQATLEPLMPAVSALSATRDAARMGALLVRVTRYIVLLLEIAGLPLILFGSIVLTLWVGPVYARHCLPILRVLITAQLIRNLFAAYATMIIATGQQRHATLSGLCEAFANLLASILLGRHFGAIGVAYGTLLGAFVGIAVHLILSLPRTTQTLAIPRLTLLREAWLRPALAAIPTLLLLPFFPNSQPTHALYWASIPWAAATLLILWRFALTPSERSLLASPERRRFFALA